MLRLTVLKQKVRTIKGNNVDLSDMTFDQLMAEINASEAVMA